MRSLSVVQGFILSTLVAVLLAAPSPAPAEILEAKLGVAGMTCPFCAFGIEKKLRDVDGVTDVDISLDDGRITLRLAAENVATVDDVEAAVGASGFKLSALHLTVRGALEKEGDVPVVQAGKSGRFALLNASGQAALAGPFLDRLEKDARNGPVQVTGTVHARNADTIELRVSDDTNAANAAP